MTNTAPVRTSPRVREAAGAKRALDAQNLLNVAKKTIVEANKQSGLDINSFIAPPSTGAAAPAVSALGRASTTARPPPQQPDDVAAAVAQPPKVASKRWVDAMEEDDAQAREAVAANAATVIQASVAAITDGPVLSAAGIDAAADAIVDALGAAIDASQRPPSPPKPPPTNLDGVLEAAAHEPPAPDVPPAPASPAPCPIPVPPSDAPIAPAAAHPHACVRSRRLPCIARLARHARPAPTASRHCRLRHAQSAPPRFLLPSAPTSTLT